MAQQKVRTGRKGSKKYGRNKIKCEQYKKEGRREKNKRRKEAKRKNRLARRKAKRS